MRTTRACSADQWLNPWHTCRTPASGELSVYFSAKRAWPASWPRSRRLALQGASDSATWLKSATSVMLACAGMVAHSVTGLASASVQVRGAGGAASVAAPGGELAPGGLTINAGRHAATVAVTVT